MSRHVSVDIGGSVARCCLAEFDGESLSVEGLHTISNRPIRCGGQWFWNAEGLFTGILEALAKARDRHGDTIDSVGIDSMGNAFCLLDRNGKMLEPPAYTRFPQDKAVRRELYRIVDQASLYGIVGLEQSKINSLYYLLVYRRDNPWLLEQARCFLMLPDLLCYWLTGETACEYTIASTSYLLDARQRNWSYPLVERLGFNPEIFPVVRRPGTVIGRLRPVLAERLGLSNLSVVFAAAHDTSSAIVCIDSELSKSAFISSGTWGILGCQLDEPLLSDAAMRANFANEGAADGKIKFVHNSPSMSILQECMDEWAAAGMGMDWDGLYALAETAPAFAACIDVNHPRFRDQESVTASIRSYCKESGQFVPDRPGEMARVVLESIVLNYLDGMLMLTDLVGDDFDGLTMLGGAAKHLMLPGFIADACGCQVRIGPVESSSIGNLVMQLYGLGEVRTLKEGQKIAKGMYRESVEPRVDNAVWRNHYEVYKELKTQL